MQWLDFVFNVVTTTVTTGGLLALALFLGRAWFLERLKGSIKHEYEDKLEKLKATLKAEGEKQLTQLKSEIDQQAEKLKIAAVSFSDVQRATISRKIEAIDHIWSAVRRARGAIPGVIHITDVLTADELLNMDANTAMRPLLEQLRGLKPMDIAPKLFEDADVARPHVGEVVWALYCAYFGIIIRCLYLLQGDARGTNRCWFRDETVLRMVKGAFGESALAEFEKLDIQPLSWLQRKFEQHLFSAFDKLLTGKAFSEAALAQAMEVEKIVAEVKASQRA